MDEIDLDIALDTMQLKIVNFLKNYNSNNKEIFISELKKMVDEKDKLYDLDEETFSKLYKK